MKRIISYIVVATVIAGCQFRDDLTEIHTSLSDIRNRLELMNESLNTLQTLANVYENSFYVESVQPLKENGKEIGYTVGFSNGQAITLLHAADGEDAAAPMISMAKDADGYWYWTLDGDFVKTPDGERIRVTGDDGKGTPAPVIDIKDGYYVISYDGGDSWITIGQAVGDKGEDGRNADSIESLDYTTSPDYVTFTLYDGSVLKIYTVSALETLQKIRSRLNSNIMVQWSMANAATKGGYVRYASDNFDDGEKTGYSIEFNNDTKVIAYETISDTDLWYPAICLSQEKEGIWTWELDGKQITDDTGAAVTSETRPKLMVEDNIWSISIDDGETWKTIGNVDTDKERHTTIDEVDISDSDMLILRLGNGVSLSLEHIPGLYIRLSEKNDIPICAGVTKEIRYEVLEGEGTIEVGVITADLWEAEVRKETDRKGVIAITTPVPYCEENVKVMVSCNGGVIMETLTFKEEIRKMESLDIVQEEVTLYAGFSEILQTVILPEGTSDKTIIWTTADPSVAVLSPNGRVVAVAEGETVITASAQGLSDECRIFVNKYEIPVESIEISTPEVTLEKNTSSHLYVKIEPFNATEKGISWASSDSTVVKVSQTGTIWALETGEAIITATHKDFTTECKVTVIEEDLSDMEREYTVNGVTFKMIRVKAGTFLMGSEDIENARPVRDVTISRDYFIAETETTLELWKTLMGYDMGWLVINPEDNFTRPVYGVFYSVIMKFINSLNEATGEKFRLPTEAEWEYAARGGNKSMGYIYSGSDDIGEVAWYIGNSCEGYINPGSGFPMHATHPVKLKKPNELGLYDMTGNVNEWCEDIYQIYHAEPETDPIGSVTLPENANWETWHTDNGVRRGGNYYCDEWNGLIYQRWHGYDECGFRLALTAE